MKILKHKSIDRLGGLFAVLYTFLVIGFYIYAETCKDPFCDMVVLFVFLPWIYVFGIGFELLGIFVSDFWIYIPSFIFNCLTFYWLGRKINALYKKLWI